MKVSMLSRGTNSKPRTSSQCSALRIVASAGMSVRQWERVARGSINTASCSVALPPKNRTAAMPPCAAAAAGNTVAVMPSCRRLHAATSASGAATHSYSSAMPFYIAVVLASLRNYERHRHR